MFVHFQIAKNAPIPPKKFVDRPFELDSSANRECVLNRGPFVIL